MQLHQSITRLSSSRYDGYRDRERDQGSDVVIEAAATIASETELKPILDVVVYVVHKSFAKSVGLSLFRQWQNPSIWHA